MCYFFFQNTGVNTRRMGYISSLPRSIATDSTILENGEYAEKFDAGPTAPKPGPILLMQAATAVILVSRSNASAVSNESSNTAIKYKTKNNNNNSNY